MPTQTWQERLQRRLLAPVDIASLIVFRIGFGALLLWEVVRYFRNDWIRTYWLEPVFHLTYYGFEWVRPWPGNGMFFHFAALGVLAALILVGAAYRLAAVLFFLGFTYAFLLEQTRYLNHFYLVSLVSFLMILLPLHRAYSVDAWLRPSLRSATAPTWALWLLRVQIAIPYFYGGLAKLNNDWLRGEPLRTWLAEYGDDPLLYWIADEAWASWFFSYGGLLLDLCIVPLLLWRRTRLVAFLGAVSFHLMNAWIFHIGIFPWFMIVASTLYFQPDWPRRLVARLRGSAPAPEAALPVSAGGRGQRCFFAALALYVVVQLVFPLRHWLYPGNVEWTGEGHRFAWRMKLSDKSSFVRFDVLHAASGRRWLIDPGDYLEPWQAVTISADPEMILQFAHGFADELRGQGFDPVEIRATAYVSLNGRPLQPLVDPQVDLMAEQRSLRTKPWILRDALPPLPAPGSPRVLLPTTPGSAQPPRPENR